MKLVSNKPIVIHVIDNVKRDLSWRICLAAELTKLGFTSILMKGACLNSWLRNSRNVLILGRLPTNDGFKSPSDPLLDLIKKADAEIIYFHDEGGFYSRANYVGSVQRSHLLDYAKDDSVRKILFWGAFQERLARSVSPSIKSKFKIIGAPRFDIYHEPYRSILSSTQKGKWTKQKSKNILIVTRGTAINPGSSSPFPLGDRIRELHKKTTSSDISVENLLFGKWIKAATDAAYLVKATSDLAMKFPEQHFVIRPHPGENEGFYYAAFGCYENISISESQDLSQDLETAKLVIGNDCTSGVEALMSGKRFINFRPSEGQQEEFSVYGLSQLGLIARSSEELHCLVRSGLGDDNIDAKRAHKNLFPLRNLVANIYTPAIKQIVSIVKSETIDKYSSVSSLSANPRSAGDFAKRAVIMMDPLRAGHAKLNVSREELDNVWESAKAAGVASENSTLLIKSKYLVISA